MPAPAPAPAPPPGPSRSRRDGAATREKLLRAALELYTSMGYHAATTPAIAARAGVAEGTIYRHFRGKEQLLNAVYQEAHRRALGIVAGSEAERSLPAPERLERIGRGLLDLAHRDPAAARIVVEARHDREVDEESRAAARGFRSALEQVIAAGKSDGLVRPGPAELWAAVWLAVVALAAARIGAREWTPDQPQTGLVLQAAWDAIKSGDVRERT